MTADAPTWLTVVGPNGNPRAHVVAYDGDDVVRHVPAILDAAPRGSRIEPADPAILPFLTEAVDGAGVLAGAEVMEIGEYRHSEEGYAHAHV